MIKSQITLKQLEAFAFVVDTGTFRAAAFALGTTQPNISARITALESALNVTLLIRDADSVRLTADGKKLLVKAREVLWAGEALIEEAGRQELIEETLRLGVTELVACTWLQGFLRLMREAYPKLRIQLEVNLSTEIEARFVEGQLDLALQTGPFKSKTLTNDALGQENYCWVVNSDLVNQMSAKPTLAELFDLTILTHAKHTQAYAALHGLATERGLRSERIVHSSALSACVPMALEGLGWHYCLNGLWPPSWHQASYTGWTPSGCPNLYFFMHATHQREPHFMWQKPRRSRKLRYNFLRSIKLICLRNLIDLIC